jgi:uncharacterized membrane protein
MYRAKCIVDDLAPESNERIKTAGDYMLRRKQQALYAGFSTSLQLTCQNKVVKSSPSFDLFLNYTKGKKNACACPNSTNIAVGSYYKSSNNSYTLCVWDFSSGKLLDITFQLTPGYVQTFASGISAVTNTIVGYEFNGTQNKPAVWDSSTGLLKKYILEPPDNIGSALFLTNISSNGKYIVGFYYPTPISSKGVLWDASTGAIINRFADAELNEFSCVTNDGIIGGATNYLGRLWNGFTGELLTVFEPLNFGDFTRIFSISSDGQFIVGLSTNDILYYGKSMIWDRNGQLLSVQPENPLQEDLALNAISSDGATLAGSLGAGFGTIYTWNRATGKLLPVKFEVPNGADYAFINALS